MARPRLLDLFCGAGGSSAGFYRAGFDVTGVDLRPQPRYPFRFIRGDALAMDLVGYDAVAASPPCQAYSVANHIHGRTDHPDLIGQVRGRLEACGVPWVMENVPGAPLRNAITLCGLAFGLGVRRHRLFESNVLLFALPCIGHDVDYVICFGGGVRGRARVVGRSKGGGPVVYRPFLSLERGQRAMGVDWMTRAELSQAIPPAFTEFLGRQLLCYVAGGA